MVTSLNVLRPSRNPGQLRRCAPSALSMLSPARAEGVFSRQDPNYRSDGGSLGGFLGAGLDAGSRCSALERRIEARMDHGSLRYDILSPQELGCSTLLVWRSSNSRTARIGVYPLRNRRCGGDPDTASRRFDLRSATSMRARGCRLARVFLPLLVATDTLAVRRIKATRGDHRTTHKGPRAREDAEHEEREQSR
jgi:hypothetical protein